MSYTVSVAMATYNGEKFITKQLDSIMNQSVPVDEVIIRDDISTDNTAEVIRNYIKEHGYFDRIHFEVNDKNLGYASNFIGALKKTQGDYIFFCDQDDIWMPDRVENMTDVLKKHPEAGLIGSEFEPFKSSEDAPDVPGWELKKFKNDGSLEKLSFNSENIFIGCQGCTMAMTRSFLDKVMSYWYEGWAHDEFVWKLALSMDQLYFFHRTTLKRRLHSSNVTLHKEHEKEKRLRYLYDLQRSHERTREFLEEFVRKEKLIDENEINRRTALLNRHIKATRMRIELIEQKKFYYTIWLLAYTDCYHKARSIPVELMMALK